MVSSVLPNHMTTAMTSWQLASLWILPQVNNVAAYTINFILDQTQWVARLFTSDQIVGLSVSFTNETNGVSLSERTMLVSRTTRQLSS